LYPLLAPPGTRYWEFLGHAEKHEAPKVTRYIHVRFLNNIEEKNTKMYVILVNQAYRGSEEI